MRPQLRIFTGDESLATLPDPSVPVTLGEITDLLVEASQMQRTWLNDFSDDDVQVSADLFEVLCAYRQLKPVA